MKQFIIWGFGILLLTMAICQITTFSYFYHIMRNYLLPLGDGVQLLSLFVLPIAGSLIIMELSGAAGLLLLGKDNVLKTTMTKAGLAAVVVWFLLILILLLRDAPIGSAGFFGERLRQTMGWPILLQSLIFVVWGWTAYVLSEQDDIS